MRRLLFQYCILKKTINNLFLKLKNFSQSPQEFNELQKIIGYTFKNTLILKIALSHKSLGNGDLSGFERMEFLGDSILGMIIAEELFSHFLSYDEGQLSKLKSKIVSKKYLAKRAKNIRLGNFIRMSTEAIQSGGKESDSILADSMESLICAIYLDGGLIKAKRFISRYILDNFQVKIKSDDLRDYKSILQEFTQSKYQKLPEYRIVNESGPEHEKTFSFIVYINNQQIGDGIGPNKKDAQQNAAKKACNHFNI